MKKRLFRIGTASGFFYLKIKKFDVCPVIVQQVFGKVIPHHPVEICCCIAERMALTRQHHKVKPLICLDKLIDNPKSVTRMYIIVNISVNEQQVPF
jgi:hypothetical protein